MINGNMVGAYNQMGKTLTLVDENGNEIVGVIVDQEVVFTACDNDVREGMVYASDEGVSVGTKVIPIYHTCQGARLITKGSPVIIPNMNTTLDYYDYTKLQAIICLFNTTLDNSVAAQKVAIEDRVYNVQSTESVSTVIKNHDAQTIDLGIVNDSSTNWVIKFFTYKEID